MKPLRIIILLLLLVSAYLLFSHSKRLICPEYPKKFSQGENVKVDLPFHKGERLIYDVYYKKIKLGESVLTFHGEEEMEGKEAYHITFSTNLPGFEDVEEIYADKETFLPFKIYRLIKRLGGFTTRIREEYDQTAFKVKIKNQGTLLSKESTIEKDGPIHNAILLTYYCRTKPIITKDEKYKVSLPTVDFDIAVKGKETVTTDQGEYPVYVFVSSPSKFTFWLCTDRNRIPIKIEGHGAMGYSLIFREESSTR